MIVGIPKEIKNNENRIGMVPGGIQMLVSQGHKVYVQKGAGLGIGLGDHCFTEVGAEILPTIEDVYEKAEMIVKVKEPLAEERKLLKPKQLLFTFLHLAADEVLTKELMASGSTCVAYETIEAKNGTLPLLNPMSEVAGRMAVQIGAHYL